LISQEGGLVAQFGDNDPKRKRGLLIIWISLLFDVTEEYGKRFPSVNTEFLYSNVGLIPLLRVYIRFLTYELAREGKDWTKIVESLRAYLQPIYEEYGAKTAVQLASLRRQRVGESGFNTTNDEMTHLIKMNYQPDFPWRQTLSEIAKDAHGVAIEIIQINRKGIASGKTNSEVFPSFDQYLFQKTFNVSEINSDTFGSIVTSLHIELVEGSGGKKAEEANRLAKLLGLKSIVENETLRNLDNLRNYCDHALRALNPHKKQDVIALLKQLTGRAELADINELSAEDFKAAARELLEDIHDHVLRPALERLK
jgi:hypothetical protein